MRRGGIEMKKWRLFMEWALQVIGMSVVVVLGMTVLTGGQIWLGFSKASDGRMVSDLPVKMMLVTVFVSAVTSSGVYTSYIPAGMCLNCRRKDALMGMQIMKLVVAVLMSAITLLLAAVGDWQFVRGNTAEALEILAVAFCALILVTSVGEVVGLVYLRFRKIGMIIMVSFFAIGGGALGAIVAMNIEKSIRFDFKFTNVLIYTAAATAVVWILDIIISRRLLEGLEVQ